MGIPYSKEINQAFDQVTPLVASGFEVLQTTRNISLLLAAIQVLTVILLSLILCVLFVLLVIVNPDLERERKHLVTPWLRWVCVNWRTLIVGGFAILLGVIIGAVAGLWLTERKDAKKVGSEVAGPEAQGKDTQAVKDGKAKQ